MALTAPRCVRGCFGHFTHPQNLAPTYLDEFAPDLRGNHVAVPQVPHAEHEAQLPVPLRNHRVLTEHQRLRALLGLRHLNEHAADEKGVHDGSQQRLEEEQDDALWTLLSDVAVAVADGRLRLDEKQERGGKVVHVGDARGVRRVVAAVAQVAADVGDHPPHRCHDQPCDGVSENEDEQVPAPLQIHERGEEIGDVSAGLPAKVTVLDVAAAVLLHEPLPLSFHRSRESNAPVGADHLVVLSKFPPQR